jgi:hypothetical protein
MVQEQSKLNGYDLGNRRFFVVTEMGIFFFSVALKRALGPTSYLTVTNSFLRASKDVRWRSPQAFWIQCR